MTFIRLAFCWFLLCSPLLSTADAQEEDAPVLVVPQAGCYAANGKSALTIHSVEAKVAIENAQSETGLSVRVQNTTENTVTGRMMVPVPPGSAVQSLTCSSSVEPLAQQLKSNEEAWGELQSHTWGYQEPALVEFSGLPLVMSETFSIEPQGQMEFLLNWRTQLPKDGERVDFTLPRSQRLDYSVPWFVQGNVTAQQPIYAVYSPSHQIQVQPQELTRSLVRLEESEQTKPGPFRMSILTGTQPLAATLWTQPATSFDGGWFQLLLAGDPSPKVDLETSGWNREVVFVIDRSSSMRGPRIEKVVTAIGKILDQLQPGDTCNVLTYADQVEAYAPAPVKWSKATPDQIGTWLDKVQPRGGTNIHAALSQALKQNTQDKMLRVVFFLTDGLPTSGEYKEQSILSLLPAQNPHDRRIFTFGLGAEINSPLLEKLAQNSRGRSHFCLEDNEIEPVFLKAWEQLDDLLFTQARLEVATTPGNSRELPVQDVIPQMIPDLSRNEPVVLLGKYYGEEPIELNLKVDYRGEDHALTIPFVPQETPSKERNFIPRLWAARKMSVLVDDVRQEGSGADYFTYSYRQEPTKKVEDTLGEMLDLSTRFGVITEYTAFLAQPMNRDLQSKQTRDLAMQNFSRRAIQTRSGYGGIQQEINNGFLQNQMALNGRNLYFNAQLEPMVITSVQQIGTRTFFRQGQNWIEGELLQNPPAEETPPTEIVFGSKDYFSLLRELTPGGDQGVLALRGDIVFQWKGRILRVQNPPETSAELPPVFQNQALELKSNP